MYLVKRRIFIKIVRERELRNEIQFLFKLNYGAHELNILLFAVGKKESIRSVSLLKVLLKKKQTSVLLI